MNYDADEFENPEDALHRQSLATRKLIEIAERMPPCQERDRIFKQADELLSLHEEALVLITQNTTK